MAFDDPTDRPPSQVPCIYWSGSTCTANKYFPEADISCFNEGNCNGFGTCRGCSKYDQGGLKIDESNGLGEKTQTPINLRLYNIRAKIQTCCNWEGAPVDFHKGPATTISGVARQGLPVFVPKDFDFPGIEPGETISEDGDTVTTVSIGTDSDGNATVTTVVQVTDEDNKVTTTTTTIPTGYFKTRCKLTEAAPWQQGFTDENPSAYGCNGAKPECPFYTGPRFQEVVDAKMDLGNRVTAKQILELRFYSNDWASLDNPRAVWDQLFNQRDIYAWARDRSGDPEKTLPGHGLKDDGGNYLVEKNYIQDLKATSPTFVTDPAKVVSTGTPVIGGLPNFPDLVKEPFDLALGIKVIFPAKTSRQNPYVRKIFTKDSMKALVVVQLNSDLPAYAINVTKYPQNGLSDSEFISFMLLEHFEDMVKSFPTAMGGTSFFVPLHFGGSVRSLNHIKIFQETGIVNGSYISTGVFIDATFYHAHVAQTKFYDAYGQGTTEPWINHFTNLEIQGTVLPLTNNTTISDVFWNTISSAGKKTVYAIETSVEEDSTGENIEWELLGCGQVMVTYKSPKINRVYPWQSWGKDSKDLPLYVKVDRSDNDALSDNDERLVELELVLASTKGTLLPPNVAMFRVPVSKKIKPLNLKKDVLKVRYAYTEYVQGPLKQSDLLKLKFPSDATSIIDSMPYEIVRNGNSFIINGTFLKVGSFKFFSCDELLGDCYTKAAKANELLARQLYMQGGVGEEDVLKNSTQMINDCASKFNANFTGQHFEDGTPVSYSETAYRLQNMNLREGSQHYMFVFSDEEGRPIGIKRQAFLTQSNVARCRDVEIRYKWAAQLQHYPHRDGLFLLARFAEKVVASTDYLVNTTISYDPICGDHHETTTNGFSTLEFDLTRHKHGPLWYPYNKCLTPTYHTEFFYSVDYDGKTVEGFEGGLRRDYWERMRVYDKYSPIIWYYIYILGCYWSVRETNLNAYAPFLFMGYTKFRTDHLFGPFSTDRESMLVSRHMEKRNLTVAAETVEQESGGATLDLSSEFKDILFLPSGDLASGSSTQTPIWTHIQESMSAVDVTSEELLHPFGNLLLQRVGDHTFSEQFLDGRFKLSDVFTERDYTITDARGEDGSLIHTPDESTLNTSSGDELQINEGDEIKYVFKISGGAWAWLAPVPPPERGVPRITGLYIANPTANFLKKDMNSATHVEEGSHVIFYKAPTFDEEGAIATEASISLDDGPKLYISQSSGSIFLPEDEKSPYRLSEHEGEEYKFELYGPGAGGLGVLADNRGLQRFEKSPQNKFSTLAGVLVNLVFDVNELPYDSINARELSKLSDFWADVDNNVIKIFEEEDISTFDSPLNLLGQYYVDDIQIDFNYGSDFDIPAITILGKEPSGSISEEIFSPTNYVSGVGVEGGTSKTLSFSIKKRLVSLTVRVGARRRQRQMDITDLRINIRNPVDRDETVVLYEPRVHISVGNTGTHHPSQLEFYYHRTIPDYAKNYVSGSLGAFTNASSPDTSVKFTSRLVKDIIPQFDFTDPTADRFPYESIVKEDIPGYSEDGGYSYIDGALAVCGKGWTLKTRNHEQDPGLNKSHHNFFDRLVMEDAQERLYNDARSLLGDKLSVFSGFWHPYDVEFFSEIGVDLSSFAWQLTMGATVAPIDRVFRHENYGCEPGATNEYFDGTVHYIDNWQAKGAWLYLCDPKFNYACYAVVMNKCYKYLFDDYGTPAYAEENIVDQYTYTMVFPPRDVASYVASGLIDTNYTAGTVNGISPSAAIQATAGTSAQFPSDAGSPGGPRDETTFGSSLVIVDPRKLQ